MTAGINLIKPPALLTETQLACIDLLEQTMTEVRAGNVQGIAILALMDSGYGSVIAATDAGALNLACDDLKRQILDNVKNSPKTAAIRSRILQA